MMVTNKLKKSYFYFIPVLILIPIIWLIGFLKEAGDMRYTSQSSNDAEKRGLLISKYKSSKNSISINGITYRLKDAWTGYYGKNEKTNIPQDLNSFSFFMILENVTTKSQCLGHDDIDVLQKITYKGSAAPVRKWLGEITGCILHLDFEKNSTPISPDTLRFDVKTTETVSEDIFFYKEN